MKARFPTYQRHASGLARVELNGKTRYLGKFDTPESRQEYIRVIGEWELRGRQPAASQTAVTVDDIILAHVAHIEKQRANPAKCESVADKLYTMKLSFKPLRALYGSSRAADFGPMALQAVGERMAEAGLRRSTVLKRINYVRKLFQWACGRELIPPLNHHALDAIASEEIAGGAKEPQRFNSVPESHVFAIIPFLPPSLQAALELQWITGMRSGELTRLTAAQIDMSRGDVWLYRPLRHKTRHRGHSRIIALTQRCQQLLQPLLIGDPNAPIFSPRRAQAERQANARAKPWNLRHSKSWRRRGSMLAIKRVPAGCLKRMMSS